MLQRKYDFREPESKTAFFREVAKKLLPDLSEKSEEIIRTHMWPVTSELPTCREGVIVSLADKVVAVRDFLSFGESRFTDGESYSAPALQGMENRNRYSA